MTIPQAPARARFAVPHLRWAIASLLLCASVLNYVDRQALSYLATTIQDELRIDDVAYARVTQAFLLCYAVAYPLAGRVVDRVGPRLAEALFIAWWSAANMLTGLAGGATSLAAVRGLLGLGESGHYAASAKAVAQWFPAREKGIAVGMYVMGGTLGAAVGAPLVVALARDHGWRGAFVATGALGFVLASAWLVAYRPPAEHPWLGDRERRLLAEAGVLGPSEGPRAAPRWRDLLGLRSVWLLLVAKMLTDSVWFFYTFWFAKYLREVRGFGLAEVGWMAAVFLAADIGCLLGGWLSGRLIRRGTPPPRARLIVMAGAAAVLAFNFALPMAPGRAAPLAMAGLFACAAMVWMTNSVTLVIDLLPPSAVGSAQGLIGMGGSLGGTISQGIVGSVVASYSYGPIFAAMGLLHPIAILILASSLPQARAGRPATGIPERTSDEPDA